MRSAPSSSRTRRGDSLRDTNGNRPHTSTSSVSNTGSEVGIKAMQVLKKKKLHRIYNEPVSAAV